MTATSSKLKLAFWIISSSGSTVWFPYPIDLRARWWTGHRSGPSVRPRSGTVRRVSDVLATLGDLVEDVAIRVDDPVNVATDTAARIERRRGGSAANVAAMAAQLGHRSRFVGQVGVDAIGTALIADLAADGVDTSFVRRGGRTGTIAVLVDARANGRC